MKGSVLFLKENLLFPFFERWGLGLLRLLNLRFLPYTHSNCILKGDTLHNPREPAEYSFPFKDHFQILGIIL